MNGVATHEADPVVVVAAEFHGMDASTSPLRVQERIAHTRHPVRRIALERGVLSIISETPSTGANRGKACEAAPRNSPQETVPIWDP
jgi:hypothetical protein